MYMWILGCDARLLSPICPTPTDFPTSQPARHHFGERRLSDTTTQILGINAFGQPDQCQQKAPHCRKSILR